MNSFKNSAVKRIAPALSVFAIAAISLTACAMSTSEHDAAESSTTSTQQTIEPTKDAPNATPRSTITPKPDNSSPIAPVDPDSKNKDEGKGDRRHDGGEDGSNTAPEANGLDAYSPHSPGQRGGALTPSNPGIDPGKNYVIIPEEIIDAPSGNGSNGGTGAAPVIEADGGVTSPEAPGNSNPGGVPGNGGDTVAPVNPSPSNPKPNNPKPANPKPDNPVTKQPTLYRPAGVAPADVSNTQIRNFIERYNQIRTENGLPAVPADQFLIGTGDWSQLSQRHTDAKGALSAHEGYLGPNEVAYGNGTYAENYFVIDGEYLAEGWWDSATHRETIYKTNDPDYFADGQGCIVFNMTRTSEGAGGWDSYWDARASALTCDYERVYPGDSEPTKLSDTTVKATDVDTTLRDYKAPSVKPGAAYDSKRTYGAEMRLDMEQYQKSENGGSFKGYEQGAPMPTREATASAVAAPVTEEATPVEPDTAPVVDDTPVVSEVPAAEPVDAAAVAADAESDAIAVDDAVEPAVVEDDAVVEEDPVVGDELADVDEPGSSTVEAPTDPEGSGAADVAGQDGADAEEAVVPADQ